MVWAYIPRLLRRCVFYTLVVSSPNLPPPSRRLHLLLWARGLRLFFRRSPLGSLLLDMLVVSHGWAPLQFLLDWACAFELWLVYVHVIKVHPLYIRLAFPRLWLPSESSCGHYIGY